MVIKIFKISTKELYTFRNKLELYTFIQEVTNRYPSFNTKIDALIQYLPVEDYCRVM